MWKVHNAVQCACANKLANVVGRCSLAHLCRSVCIAPLQTELPPATAVVNYGCVKQPAKELTTVVKTLVSLAGMDKNSMSNACSPQTDRMEVPPHDLRMQIVVCSYHAAASAVDYNALLMSIVIHGTHVAPRLRCAGIPSQQCLRGTQIFLKETFGMKNTAGTFVDGVRAFVLEKPIGDASAWKDDDVVDFHDNDSYEKDRWKVWTLLDCGFCAAS